MMNDAYNFSKILEGESIDFKVKSTAPMPLSKSMTTLIFGVVMTTIMGYVFYSSGCGLSDFLTCLASENLFLYFIAFILLIAGIASTVIGVKNILGDGPLVIGTPTRLILIKGDKIESIAWSQFLDDIAVKGSRDKGTVTLKKRTGRYASNDSKNFIHDEELRNLSAPKEATYTLNQLRATLFKYRLTLHSERRLFTGFINAAFIAW